MLTSLEILYIEMYIFITNFMVYHTQSKACKFHSCDLLMQETELLY